MPGCPWGLLHALGCALPPYHPAGARQWWPGTVSCWCPSLSGSDTSDMALRVREGGFRVSECPSLVRDTAFGQSRWAGRGPLSPWNRDFFGGYGQGLGFPTVPPFAYATA